MIGWLLISAASFAAVAFGLVTGTAIARPSQDRIQSPVLYWTTQAMWALIGLVALVFAMLSKN
jgi:cell division protein FtsW (lipid II flippase)